MLDTQALITHVSSYLRRELTPTALESWSTLSITLPIQGLHLRSLPSLAGDWFFWGYPDAGTTILGTGNAIRITASGPDRLAKIGRSMQKLCANWNWLDPELTDHKPLSYICFAFDPNTQMKGIWNGLPNSGLFLPELTLQQTDNHCVASFNVDLNKNRDIATIQQRWIELFSGILTALNQPHSPPGCKTILTKITTSADQKQWRRLVTAAQTDISTGNMEKVVLARQQRVQAQRSLDPKQLITTLNYLYPNSTLIATNVDGHIFVSATPERLARNCNGNIICDAMAGTAQRSPVEQQDAELGKQLLADPKTRHEHQLVVDGIKAALRPLCTDIASPQQPSIKRLRGLQHLFTEIRGYLKLDIGLLQAAAKLHPTAAVNGHPNTAASNWLQQHEPFDRGWYAGAAGWLDYHGNGELAVLLRCALLDQDQAELFAGAGITAGSDADAEYAETELKFGVMLEALENS